MSEIRFGVHAPSEEIFWKSWEEAEIVFWKTETKSWEFRDNYKTNVEVASKQGWNGIIIKSHFIEGTGELSVTQLPGWYTNVIVYGAIANMMLAGLPQYDEDGNLKNIFERSKAIDFFSLTEAPFDEVTKRPKGYKNSSDVVYYDLNDVKTPYNVRQ